MTIQKNNIKTICVFCGSREGNLPIYTQKARELGYILAEHNITLVYGGGSIGLMGTIADAVLEKNGSVIGVIPKKLHHKELAHAHLTELHVVDTMHQRKALMAELSDAFIAMPGGIGTFEELFEMATWNQLGFQHKPMGLLNVNQYYTPLQKLLENAIQQGFVDPEYLQLFTIADEPLPLFQALLQHQLPPAILKKYIPDL